MKPAVIALVVLGAATTPSPSLADWLPYGNPAVTETGNQHECQMALDGAGGIFITWSDYRADLYLGDIYIQRLDEDGDPLFGPHGVPVCDEPGHQFRPSIVSDGAGGAIVTWMDQRLGLNTADIYVQRIDALGQRVWGAGGAPLCTALNFQITARAVSDGAGGAIVAWEDFRFGDTNSSVFAQRVNASGTTQWAPDGVPISTATNNQSNPKLVSDGAGGAIIMWDDTRFNAFGVYVRRVTAAGTPQWANNGVYVAHNSNLASIAEDGSGGAIIAWTGDGSPATTPDIYVQRYSAAGVPQWAASGVPVCTAPFQQREPCVVSDGLGGAIVAWMDARDGAEFDVYARRFDATGSPTWPEVVVCAVQGDQRVESIATDGESGAILAWTDERGHPSQGDVYAARLLASGVVWWVDGVCPLDNSQLSAKVLSDGAGGGFFVWDDNRTYPETESDVYAARYFGGGVLDAPTPTGPAQLELSAARPNPSSGPVAFELRLPEASDVEVDVYNVAGRREATLELHGLGAGVHRVALDGRGTDERPLPAGVYLVRVRANGLQATRRVMIVR